MIVYTTIANDDESYSLSALLTSGKYEFVSLTFKLDGEDVDAWDNDFYLYYTVLPYLKGEQILSKDFEEMHELMQQLNDHFPLTI